MERTAEAIGDSIAAGEQEQIQRAVQLDLPMGVGKPVPILYVQMDGTGIPVVKKETVSRQGKTEGQPSPTREVKSGCVFTQTAWDKEGYPIREPDSTTYTGAIEAAEELGKRIYGEAWKRGWSRAEKKVVMGDGAAWIWNLGGATFPGAVQVVDLYPARQHLWELARRLHPNDEVNQKAWMKLHPRRLLDKGKSKSWFWRFAPSLPPIPRGSRKPAMRPTTLRGTQRACAIPSFVAGACLSAPVRSKPAAGP